MHAEFFGGSVEVQKMCSGAEGIQAPGLGFPMFCFHTDFCFLMAATVTSTIWYEKGSETSF